MSNDTFQRQIGRLQEVYGRNVYPPARSQVFWNYVKLLPDYWFEETVTEWIGKRLKPPLLNDFQESIRKQEAREHEKTKETTRQASQDFYHAQDGRPAGGGWEAGEVSEAEAKFKWEAIRQRLNHTVSDEEYYAIFPRCLDPTFMPWIPERKEEP